MQKSTSVATTPTPTAIPVPSFVPTGNAVAVSSLQTSGKTCPWGLGKIARRRKCNGDCGVTTKSICGLLFSVVIYSNMTSGCWPIVVNQKNGKMLRDVTKAVQKYWRRLSWLSVVINSPEPLSTNYNHLLKEKRIWLSLLFSYFWTYFSPLWPHSPLLLWSVFQTFLVWK